MTLSSFSYAPELSPLAAAALRCLRANGAATFAQLARDLRCDEAALTPVITELRQAHLLGEDAAALSFAGHQAGVIGVDLGGTKVFGAVANLDGEILVERYVDHNQARAEDSFQALCEVISELARQAEALHLPVVGLGVGVPGIVTPEDGVVQAAPSLDWTSFPLRQRLQERFAFPLVVENDANLAALGEAWYGAARPAMNLVFVAIGTWLGAGIVLNGEIYRGHHAAAGEIGYMIPDRAMLAQSFPGMGALELQVSGTAIAWRGRDALRGVWPEARVEALTSEDVFQAARAGEPWAVAVLDETNEYLAQALANVTALLDPQAIVLGGGVARSADLMIAPVCERLARVLPVLPEVRASRLGYRASVMGAVAGALRQLMG